MPIRTRRELLKLAERYRVPIVEDATYRELYFHEAPPPSLRELDAQNLVIHLNSFSKVHGAGAAARLAVGGAVDRRSDRDHQAAARSAHAEPRAVRDGAADPRGQLRRAPEDAARRARAAVRADGRRRSSGTCRRARCGSRGRRAACICGAGSRRASARARCSIGRWPPASRSSPATRSIRIRPGESELRLCFSSVTPEAIDEAIRRLASAIGRRPEVLQPRARMPTA